MASTKLEVVEEQQVDHEEVEETPSIVETQTMLIGLIGKRPLLTASISDGRFIISRLTDEVADSFLPYLGREQDSIQRTERRGRIDAIVVIVLSLMLITSFISVAMESYALAFVFMILNVVLLGYYLTTIFKKPKYNAVDSEGNTGYSPKFPLRMTPDGQVLTRSNRSCVERIDELDLMSETVRVMTKEQQDKVLKSEQFHEYVMAYEENRDLFAASKDVTKEVDEATNPVEANHIRAEIASRNEESRTRLEAAKNDLILVVSHEIVDG